MTPTERHNALARNFVLTVGRETKTFSELLVATESILTAVLTLLERRHHIAPQNAVALAEETLAQAIERFTGDGKPPPRSDDPFHPSNRGFDGPGGAE